MSDQNPNKLLSKVLKSAGLISSQQLAKALQIQAEYPQTQLSEILILQEVIQPQTVDFFVDQWPTIKAEGQQLLLGQYLQDAQLLDLKQVEFIVAEQQQEWRLFGEIAVEQGWIKQVTVDFFVNNLAVKVPRLISFNALEEYNQKFLNLENKYTNHEAILTRILAWTGGNSNLSKLIAQEFANADFNISAGKEVDTVDKFIEGNLIKNWQNIEAGKYFRYVEYQLPNNRRQDPILLLKTYREILLVGSKQYDQSNTQNELLVLGLIVEQDRQVRPSSLIYQQIFHQDWVAAQIAKLQFNNAIIPKAVKEKRSSSSIDSLQNDLDPTPQVKSQPTRIATPQNETNNIQKNPQESNIEANFIVGPDLISQNNTLRPNDIESINYNQQNEQANSKALEPITKLGSLITLIGIIIFIPLVWAINNYYSPVQSTFQSGSDSLKDMQKLQEFCQDLNLIDPKTSLSLISQLENHKLKIVANLPDDPNPFPDNCEVALNKLRVLAAPQLGKENRVIEAIKHLCQVPADSESLNEAKLWLDNWYDSPGWGKRTKAYLALTPECAANDR